MSFKEKVIVIDWSLLLHMSVHASRKANMYAPYTAVTMLLGSLKRIGLEPYDEVILACDGKHNWRKDLIPQVKADRVPLDKAIYEKFNDLLKKLEESTFFHVLWLDHIEADDIASVCCRYFKDKEVILVSSDGDWEQLWHYDNVKIYSPHAKSKRYKVKSPNFNAYKRIAKMVMTKGHNNLDIAIENEEDYRLKEKCVNLINLPEWVEENIKKALENLRPKEDNIKLFPFHKLKERYGSLYNDKSKVITYEQCVKRLERKKKRKKKKRKLKEKVKK